MTAAYAPNLSHFGVFCKDIDEMTHFYCGVFDLVVTDRGQGVTFPMTIVFLSGRPDQHHQLVLATGRAADAPSTVMQLSFKVQTLDHLREAKNRALRYGAKSLRSLNHGNALSIYFEDIEGNLVEVYLDTPWYVAQPHGDPLDLSMPDEAIWATTEQTCRSDPTFMPVSEWAARFGKAK
ncbi:VOC family protein [Rhodoferax sp. GW822-FHT02A01]|uniref:VOC family protein n=1 Tax=Rhodoferax sp. GW822-FHT02A01 TaxID=3141537 RepID=UPI00315CB24A